MRRAAWGARRGLAVGCVLLAGAGLLAGARASERELPLLEIDGVINPLSARYLERGLEQAAESGAPAVILRIDTPGGTVDAMREMVRDILASPVPVIAHVGPPGARAASAGMFIVTAAHVATMAPGTNIGAAHPVALGQGGQDATLADKAVNDMAAMARAIAKARDRNARWMEDAVRRSVSASADEALQAKVIDLVVPDLQRLLSQLDGRTVTLDGRDVVLDTAGAALTARPMNLAERILQVITDPNIAYILFTLGVLGIAAELYSPGLVFPGVIGAVAIILALVAFGSLPINWAGLLLVLLGLGLFVAETLTPGLGLLAVGGAVAFLLGSLMLYRPLGPVDPALPSAQLSPWVVLAMAAGILGFLALVARQVLRARHLPVTTGAAALVGHPAVALSDLAPGGTVRLAGETWTAVAQGRPIKAGEPVHVVGVDGVTLRVTAADSTTPEEGELP